jgi:Tfp pilus assembly protein PilZ
MGTGKLTSSRAGRRKHHRVKPKGLVAIVLGDREKMSPVDDVSRGGLFLRTEEALPLGAAISMELRRADRATAVPLSGRVVRQVPDGASTAEAAHGLGILFDPMAPEVEAELVKMLEEAGHVEVAPPPLPSGLRTIGGVEVPSGTSEVPDRGPRPEGDPFQERPEPKLPRSGLPDEKVEYFRALVLQKNETLSRARAIYAEAIAEADQLHSLATLLHRNLELALTHVEQGRATARELGAFQARVNHLEAELAAKQSVMDSTGSARIELEHRSDELRAELATLSAQNRRNEEASRDAEERARDAERALRGEQKARAASEEKVAKLEQNDQSLKKVRDELGGANRKAMEAQAGYNKERRLKEELQTRLESAEKVAAQLAAEGNGLRADYAALKKKLIAAEDALEAAVAKSKRKPGTRPG